MNYKAYKKCAKFLDHLVCLSATGAYAWCAVKIPINFILVTAFTEEKQNNKIF